MHHHEGVPDWVQRRSYTFLKRDKQFKKVTYRKAWESQMFQKNAVEQCFQNYEGNWVPAYNCVTTIRYGGALRTFQGKQGLKNFTCYGSYWKRYPTSPLKRNTKQRSRLENRRSWKWVTCEGNSQMRVRGDLQENSCASGHEIHQPKYQICLNWAKCRCR